jgi:succinate--hydroxymethylglutarate CoA-transferase
MFSFGAIARAALRVHCRCPASQVAARTSQLCRRSIATKSDVNKQMIEKLPLAGIKVLDMTRVLAGVCG